jgi:aspartyl protease family protein
MSDQAIKMASTLAVGAVLLAYGYKHQWLRQGEDMLRSVSAPHAAIPAPALPPMPQQQAATPYQPPQSRPRTTGWGVEELSPDSYSQYRANIEVNGARIQTLVDTGASWVALTAEDARQLNLDPPRSAYTIKTQTANGVAMSAPVKLREIRIGNITVYDVDALVSEPGKLGVSLLGMSFLRKLSSFQVADGRFVMKQ